MEYYPNYNYGIRGIVFSEKDLKKGNAGFSSVWYFTYDKSAVELFMLVKKPVVKKNKGKSIFETVNPSVEGWIWTAFKNGGTSFYSSYFW